MRRALSPTPAPPDPDAGGAGPFANFDVVVRSWYAALRAGALRRGQARSLEFLGRRVALWRERDGAVHALDARCPHLGADLGKGAVVGGGLRCPFHHWAFDGEGRCVLAPGHTAAPARRARAYGVAERFGLLWLYNGRPGDRPPPELPDGDDPSRYHVLVPPARRIRCHPHLVIGNGLDAEHFETLHGVRWAEEPRLERAGEHRLSLHVRGRPGSPTLAALAGASQDDVQARFTTVGGNLAWLTVTAPFRFHVLFAARPVPGRGSETRLVLFLPRDAGLAPLRALVLLYILLHDDRRVLDRIDFHPGFVATDAALRTFAELVDGLEVE